MEEREGEGRGRVLTQKVERDGVQSKLAVCVWVHWMFARSALCCLHDDMKPEDKPIFSNPLNDLYQQVTGILAYRGLEKTKWNYAREV